MNSVILFLQKAKRKPRKEEMGCRRFCFYFYRESVFLLSRFLGGNVTRIRLAAFQLEGEA